MLVFFSSSHNIISGRTSIQKLMYFSMNYLGLKGDFIAHYFGPYSTSVDSILGQLVSIGLIEERAILTDNSRKMYHYNLTHDGQVYSRKLAKKHDKKMKVIKKITDAFENIGGNRITRFACAAKVHYLAKGNRILTIDSAINEAKSLGWHLSESEIVNAAQTIKSLASR